MEALKSLLSYLNSLTWTREQVIMNLVFLAVFVALVWLFIRGLVVVLKVKSLVAELQTTKTQAAESGKLVQQLCQERTTLYEALQARVAQLAEI